ncbi:MAG: hypothetical protein IT580_24620 [Verrucomicrobiales bacterium]|nr:hypothetical protein [Verrucomicrobiales bacterium]
MVTPRLPALSFLPSSRGAFYLAHVMWNVWHIRSLGVGGAVVLASARIGAADAVPQPEQAVGGGVVRLGRVTVDAQARSASFPARVNMTHGTVEYALVADYGKTHESLLVTDAAAVHVQSALLLLNLRATGTNAVRAEGALEVPVESAVAVRVAWDGAEGRVTRRLEELVDLVSNAGGRTVVTGRLATGPWLFSGSWVTPEGFGAHFDGSYFALIRDAIAVLNNPRGDAVDDEIHAPSVARLPALGAQVTVTLSAEPAAAAASWNAALRRTSTEGATNGGETGGRRRGP